MAIEGRERSEKTLVKIHGGKMQNLVFVCKEIKSFTFVMVAHTFRISSDFSAFRFD